MVCKGSPAAGLLKDTTPLISMGAVEEEKVGKSDSGLRNFRALWFLFLWYFFSGLTLFMNKYVITYLEGDSTLLAGFQMLLTLICGYIQMFYPIGFGDKTNLKSSKPPGFYKHMCVVGGLRFITVLFGLVALNYIAVSFTETVKSSAPAFTVIISRIILGQTTGVYVKLSLLPVMGGLALCSANELSYNLAGFSAALLTNISECCQNVYSKMLISGDAFKLNPAELQFFTSIASLAVTIPTAVLMMDWSKVLQTDTTMFLCLVINGIFFHFQTISAYVLMDYISPVTHSVANTMKRAVLIWSSVILFGNPVTTLSALGTLVVILGVLLYNIALQADAKYAHRVIHLGGRKMFVEKI